MAFKRIATAGCLCVLLVSSLRGQDSARGSIFLGVTGGFAAGRDAASISVFGSSTDCGLFTSGVSSSPSAGLRMSLPRLVSERIGLALNLSVSSNASTLTALPVGIVPIYDSQSNALVTLDRSYKLKMTSTSIGIDLSPTVGIGRSGFFSVGPAVLYQVSSKIEQTDNITGPGDYRFPDGQSAHVMNDGPTLTARKILLGPTVRAGYQFPLSSKTSIVPGLSFCADLLSITRESSWREYQLRGEVAIMVDVTPSPAPPPPPVVIPPPVVVHKPALSASVTLAGVDEQDHQEPVAKIRVNEVLHQQHAPLLPALFFDEGSSEIPDRYSKIAPAAVDSFSVDNLTGLGVLDIQRHALDIIGSRLRDRPSSRITFIGTESHDETPELGKKRAEAAREYLRSVWNIDPARVLYREGAGPMQRSNEATEDGRADNRRAEIVSSNDSTLAPVISEEIVRDFNPPLIKLNPVIKAEAGIRRWTLTITQDKNVVARYSSSDSSAPDRSDITWRLVRERIDSSLSPLVATLEVEDSTGATVSANAEVGLVLEKRLKVVDGRIERSGDLEHITYSLVAFDYNSPELGRTNELEIDDIARAVRPGANITVIGYTDRIGEEQHNVLLSEQRAQRTAAALRAKLQALGITDAKIQTAGAGIETARYRNDFPEGRILSRGVSIVVEQQSPEGAK